jgi:hypothetical protein
MSRQVPCIIANTRLTSSQGLRLRRCRNAALDRQIVQKSFDLGQTHFRGMAFAIEQMNWRIQSR